MFEMYTEMTAPKSAEGHKRYEQYVKELKYPFPEFPGSPEDCMRAVDWIVDNLIDRFKTNKSNRVEWYDFIWTALRKIRRRVTQFQMEGLEAVAIIERCTRFHIFAAHAMADYPLTGFVPNLNDKSLEKCLISLNQLYSSLNLRGIYCSNEAEFRAYSLIHFKEQDIVRNISFFDPVVRNSAPVQFALKCRYALDTRNHTLFFNLVREADFLTACMLHRHFASVRANAMLLFCKVHTRGQETFKIAIKDVIRELCFEDSSELRKFCRVGAIKFDKEYVMFDKQGFKLDPKKLLGRSSGLLITSKFIQPLSEYITGGETPGNVFDGVLFSHKFKLTFNANNDCTSDHNIGKYFREIEMIWKSIFASQLHEIISTSIFSLPILLGYNEYESQQTVDSTSTEANDVEVILDRERDGADEDGDESFWRDALNVEAVEGSVLNIEPSDVEELLSCDDKDESKSRRQDEKSKTADNSSLLDHQQLNTANHQCGTEIDQPMAADQEENQNNESKNDNDQLTAANAQREDRNNESKTDNDQLTATNAQKEKDNEPKVGYQSKTENDQETSEDKEKDKNDQPQNTDDEQVSNIDQSQSPNSTDIVDELYKLKEEKPEEFEQKMLTLTMRSVIRACVKLEMPSEDKS